jgi:hypothetical protein
MRISLFCDVRQHGLVVRHGQFRATCPTLEGQPFQSSQCFFQPVFVGKFIVRTWESKISPIQMLSIHYLLAYLDYNVICSASVLMIRHTTISDSPLYQTHHYIRHITISDTPLYQTHHYIRHTSVSDTPLYQTHRYIRHTAISDTPLYQTHRYIRHTAITDTPLYQTHHYIRHTTISDTPLYEYDLWQTYKCWRPPSNVNTRNKTRKHIVTAVFGTYLFAVLL